MANSLQDQLLKAGLVDKRQLSGVKKEKRKQDKMVRKNQIEVVDEAKLNAQRAMEEKAERDRELNRQRNEAARQKAILAQIRQLIETSRLSRSGAAIDYNFTDGSKIKKILVTQAMLDQLSNGRLAIVSFDERYDVVPKAVADKIRQRDERYVIVSNTVSAATAAEDDPYADYQIPDDLMW
jgi:uncharacterized protein YaiL (DUF2058 family)